MQSNLNTSDERTQLNASQTFSSDKKFNKFQEWQNKASNTPGLHSPSSADGEPDREGASLEPGNGKRAMITTVVTKFNTEWLSLVRAELTKPCIMLVAPASPGQGNKTLGLCNPSHKAGSSPQIACAVRHSESIFLFFNFFFFLYLWRVCGSKVEISRQCSRVGTWHFPISYPILWEKLKGALSRSSVVFAPFCCGENKSGRAFIRTERALQVFCLLLTAVYIVLRSVVLHNCTWNIRDLKDRWTKTAHD